MIGLPHYLTVSAALFTLGLLGVLTRRNAVNVLMGVELILNSANLNLVDFADGTRALIRLPGTVSDTVRVTEDVRYWNGDGPLLVNGQLLDNGIGRHAQPRRSGLPEGLSGIP